MTSTENPYRWDREAPQHRVERSALVEEVTHVLLRGEAVRLIGGRGMGKSVLIDDIAKRLKDETATRVVLLHEPPEVRSPEGCVEAIYFKLWGERPERPRFEDLLTRLHGEGCSRLILLYDEVEQYFINGTDGFARVWFNSLESYRKRSQGCDLGVVVAGGVGLLYLEKVLGSGLVSRAHSVKLTLFSESEVIKLASPLRETGKALGPTEVATLLAHSGGNPALVTFGLQHVWKAATTAKDPLGEAFGNFRRQHGSFMRSFWDSVGSSGQTRAPQRVLERIREASGSVARSTLLTATTRQSDEALELDLQQSLDILAAAGLIFIEGSDAAEPLMARATQSILNLSDTPSTEADPVAAITADVARTLGELHRLGRDFHDGGGILQEQVFSSSLAVALTLKGWGAVREPVQAAGFLDLRVSKPGMKEHVAIEVKIWGRNDYKEIQQQVDSYREFETMHGIAATLGSRRVSGWALDYESECLATEAFTRLPLPANLVGHWRVEAPDPYRPSGPPRLTDHFLVQIPKRS